MTTDDCGSPLLLRDLHDRLKRDFLEGGETALRPHHVHLFWKAALQVADRCSAGLCRGRPGFGPQDIAATTVLELYQDFPNCLLAGENFTAFLKGAVRHRFLDQCRTRRTDVARTASASKLDGLTAEDLDPIRRLISAKVREIVEQLHPDDQVVVHELEQILTVKAAVQTRGMSRANYYLHRRKVIDSLRQNPVLRRLMRMLDQ